METRKKRGIRAQTVMLIIIALQLAVLGWLCVECKPYFGAEEDPQNVVRERPPVTLPTIPGETETEPLPTEETPELNPYGRYDFQFEGRYFGCLEEKTIPGVDVSTYQGYIDWNQVKASGIQFAMIRLGYRGYGTGALVEDTYFRTNLHNALAAGLDVGVYFFSQALNAEEAVEEANFVLERIRGYEIKMPVVFDWEYISDEARTANMDPRTLTDCYIAFCDHIAAAGYTPMSYFNTYQSRKDIYIKELEQYPYWLALYSHRMTFPYKVDMWQYTCTGRVPGIQGDVDINMYFTGEEK
jgi:GH25 family lysozyme M1 (1,4-beta-N-acetylmuramidase)